MQGSAVLLVAGLSAAAFDASGAQSPAGCGAPLPDPIVHVALPGKPFTPAVSRDGCWVFVSMGGSTPGVAVIQRSAGTPKLVRTIPIPTNGTGATLTHDGKLFIVAAGPNVTFVDVSNVAAGGDATLRNLHLGGTAGAIYVSTTKDDALLFIALERRFSILVVDLAKARRMSRIDTTAILGAIPTGNAPIAVTLSNDEKYLYSTSQAQAPDWGWPNECKPEAANNPATDSLNHSKGAVLVIDMARVRANAAHSVIARVPVGCNPVRLVLSPDGGTAWVSARGDHSLVAVDTKKMLSDPQHAVIKSLRVGTAPVGMAIFDGGKKIAATNSNRFEGGENDNQSINIVDLSRGPANATVLGLIPAGAFPRELRTSPDGNTLYATNFTSGTLEVIDLMRLSPRAP